MRLSDREALHAEAVERQNTRFIEVRHDRRVAKLDEHERAVEEHWQVQERLHREERRRLNRVRWAQYHRSQAARLRATLEPLAAFHEARAQMLEGEVS